MKSIRNKIADWRLLIKSRRPAIIVLESLGVSSAIAVAFIFHTPYWIMRNYHIVAAIPLALIVCVGEWYVAREFFKLSDHKAQGRFKIRFWAIAFVFAVLSVYHLYVDNFVIERRTETLALAKRDSCLAAIDQYPAVATAMDEFKNAEAQRDDAKKRANDFDARQDEYFSKGWVTKFERRQDSLAAKLTTHNKNVSQKKKEWLAARDARVAEIKADFQAEKNRGLIHNWLAFLENNPSGAILLAVFVFVIALDTREREFTMTVGESKDPLDDIPTDLDGCAIYLASLPDTERHGLQRKLIERGIYDEGNRVKEWTLSRRIKSILEVQESVDALQTAANSGKLVQTSTNNSNGKL